MDEHKEYSILEDSIRQSFANVVWSHKIQEKQSDIYARQFYSMENIRILSASLTSAGILSIIITNQLWIKILSALLSFVTLYINSFYKSFNIKTDVSQHKVAANNLLKIRQELQFILLQVKMRQKSVNELCSDYKEIVNHLNEIYMNAPSTSNKAVRLAAKALKINGENTYSDEEIDSFLPDELHKDMG